MYIDDRSHVAEINIMELGWNIYIYMCVCVCVWIYIYIYMYSVYVFLYMCIFGQKFCELYNVVFRDQNEDTQTREVG